MLLKLLVKYEVVTLIEVHVIIIHHHAWLISV